MNARIFWTNTVIVWMCVAALTYAFAGGLTPDFIFWAFVIAMLALPIVVASSLERRR